MEDGLSLEPRWRKIGSSEGKQLCFRNRSSSFNVESLMIGDQRYTSDHRALESVSPLHSEDLYDTLRFLELQLQGYKEVVE